MLTSITVLRVHSNRGPYPESITMEPNLEFFDIGFPLPVLVLAVFLVLGNGR
jgi:hypothetical protein